LEKLHGDGADGAAFKCAARLDAAVEVIWNIDCGLHVLQVAVVLYFVKQRPGWVQVNNPMKKALVTERTSDPICPMLPMNVLAGDRVTAWFSFTGDRMTDKRINICGVN
jgi:hypothetical protein